MTFKLKCKNTGRLLFVLKRKAECLFDKMPFKSKVVGMYLLPHFVHQILGLNHKAICTFLKGLISNVWCVTCRQQMQLALLNVKWAWGVMNTAQFCRTIPQHDAVVGIKFGFVHQCFIWGPISNILSAGYFHHATNIQFASSAKQTKGRLLAVWPTVQRALRWSTPSEADTQSWQKIQKKD